MKRRFFEKSKIGLMLGLSTLLAPITSCSAFFGGDEYTITDTSITTDEETGDTIVTITFSGDNIEPLTFRIPSVTNGVDGVGIESVTSVLENNNVILTISYTDDSMEDTIITIPVVQGSDGKGISNVNVDYDEQGNTTIIFEYSDGTTSDLITIPKGTDGTDGVGIEDISVQVVGDGITLVTISYTDETRPDTSFTLTNGVSVESIEYISEESDDDNYILRITYSDGTTEDVSLPRPKGTRWYDGITDPDETIGSVGDYYLNTVTGEVFRKDESTLWRAIFSIKGSGSGSSIERYYVRFNLQEGETFTDTNLFGTTSFSVRVEENSTLDLEEIPLVKKDGYIFEGWFTSPENNVNSAQFTDLTMVSKNIDLYCHWSEVI